MNPNRRGFTLIELLVVVCIISLLAALSSAGWQSIILTRNRSGTINSLRNIAIGIQCYASENDGYMPGPTVMGVSCQYNIGADYSMGTLLWSYIGAAKPTGQWQEAKALTNPGYLKYRKDPFSPVYVLNYAIGSQAVRPWGNSNTLPRVTTIKMAMLQEVMNTSETWAMQDVDQKHSIVNASFGWYKQLPPVPVNGNQRITLYYDWHIDAVPVR